MEYAEYQREYSKKYRQEHKDYFREYQNKYRKENKRHAIYMIMDDKEISYIGSTSLIYHRLYEHINKLSHLKDRLNKKNYTYEVCNVNSFVNSKEERCFLEDILIEKYKPTFNDRSAIREEEAEITEERKRELESVAEKLKFKVYK